MARSKATPAATVNTKTRKQFAHIKDLTPDPRNARKHTPRNVGTIVDALHEVGAARSIVIDEDGVVLAGNATIDAAAQAGITKLRVVDADGSTVVAVRRTGLSPEQKARLALFDNRAAELAEWDADVLAQLAREPGEVTRGIWTDAELAVIIAASTVPDFAPVGEDEQGRLDQKTPVACPKCGYEF